jgi:hypothetical protein
VLEKVNIADIPHATEIFCAADTVDATGKFNSKTATTEGISGLISKQGLPRYALYLNIAGNVVKRTFIPQNPAKTKADGTPTAWANKVMQGTKIMMLLGDNGPTAYIELSPSVPLGQEKFVLWANK